MFSLENEIAQWRQKLLAAGIKAPIPLDELENHLREEIQRLMQTGMDARAASEAAMEKIGAAKALKIEFAKVEKEMRAAKEAKLMLALGTTIIAGCAVAFGAMLFFRFGSLSELTSAQQYSGYAALSLMLLFVFGGRFGYKHFPRIGRKKIRVAICVAANVSLVVWWIVLFRVIVPRQEYTMDALILEFAWGFIMPAGLVFGLVVGIETAARKSVPAN